VNFVSNFEDRKRERDSGRAAKFQETSLFLKRNAVIIIFLLINEWVGFFIIRVISSLIVFYIKVCYSKLLNTFISLILLKDIFIDVIIIQTEIDSFSGGPEFYLIFSYKKFNGSYILVF